MSTDEIRTLIQNVQRGVDRAAEQMTLSADRVGDGVSLTARARAVLDKILDLTERSDQLDRRDRARHRGAGARQRGGNGSHRRSDEDGAADCRGHAAAVADFARRSASRPAMVRDYTKHLKRACGRAGDRQPRHQPGPWKTS